LNAVDLRIPEIEGRVAVPYRYAYGPYYARFYAGLKEGRIVSVRCPVCKAVFLPPRPYCGRCYVDVEEEWVTCPDTGTVRAFTVVYYPFVGQPTKPPYCYALINLDGTVNELHHILGEIPFEEVRVGLRVRAVWREPEERRGTIHDIKYFAPLKE